MTFSGCVYHKTWGTSDRLGESLQKPSHRHHNMLFK